MVNSAVKRQQLEAEQRRTVLARLVLDGVTNQTRLAELVAREGLSEVTQKTISQDLKRLRAEWHAARERDLEGDLGKELARLERQYRRWLVAWRRSIAPRRKRVRKYETVVVVDAVPGEPEVRTQDGTLIREATPGSPAITERRVVEETITVEETTGDPRYAALVEKCAESIRELKGLLRDKDAGSGQQPMVQFNFNAPPQPVPALGDALPDTLYKVGEEQAAEPFAGVPPQPLPANGEGT